MQALSTKFELLYLAPYYDENGWREAQVALDEIPSVLFQFHKSSVERMSEGELMDYLARQAKAIIERCGDARNPLPANEGSVN